MKGRKCVKLRTAGCSSSVDTVAYPVRNGTMFYINCGTLRSAYVPMYFRLRQARPLATLATR